MDEPAATGIGDPDRAIRGKRDAAGARTEVLHSKSALAVAIEEERIPCPLVDGGTFSLRTDRHVGQQAQRDRVRAEPRSSHTQEHLALGIELDETLVASIGDPDVASGIDADSARLLQVGTVAKPRARGASWRRQ